MRFVGWDPAAGGFINVNDEVDLSFPSAFRGFGLETGRALHRYLVKTPPSSLAQIPKDNSYSYAEESLTSQSFPIIKTEAGGPCVHGEMQMSWSDDRTSVNYTISIHSGTGDGHIQTKLATDYAGENKLWTDYPRWAGECMTNPCNFSGSATGLTPGQMLYLHVFNHDLPDSGRDCTGGKEIHNPFLVPEYGETSGSIYLPTILKPYCNVTGEGGGINPIPCWGENCKIPLSEIGEEHKDKQTITDIWGNIVEIIIRILWGVRTDKVWVVPYQKSPVVNAIFHNGEELFNSFLPPDDADSSPWNSITKADYRWSSLHTIIGDSVFKQHFKNKDMQIPMIERVNTQSQLFFEYLEPPPSL
jgi:hypothetical protein